VITPALAAKAYAAAQSQMLSSTGDVPGQTDPAGGAGFGEMLKGIMNDAISASRQAETKITQNVQGKADLVDVVTAISSAQTSLETVMAVRDQVIAAYQQVMQMQI
jgi:flagellar hook-basal body complex protein FliE